MRDPAIVALRDRVTATVDPAIKEEQVRVTIALKDGRRWRSTSSMRSAAERPMTDADLEAKFRGNAEGVLRRSDRVRRCSICAGGRSRCRARRRSLTLRASKSEVQVLTNVEAGLQTRLRPSGLKTRRYAAHNRDNPAPDGRFAKGTFDAGCPYEAPVLRFDSRLPKKDLEKVRDNLSAVVLTAITSGSVAMKGLRSTE